MDKPDQQKTSKKPACNEKQNVHKGPTLGQKAADSLTKWAGSWTFIILFSVFLALWIYTNFYYMTYGLSPDPYPFILLNLMLSCLAAIQAPVILMSQNRQTDRDRAKAERDYAINRKSEREIESIKSDLDKIKSMIKSIEKTVCK